MTNDPAVATRRHSRAADVRIRTAKRADGHAMWEMVRESGALEANSCYAYLLLATHFGDTCLIAERAGRPVGFVAAYRPPDHDDTVFVWQIGVRSEARGHGLGVRLLERLVDAPACTDVRFLEATVTRDNRASRQLFRAFARRRCAECQVGPGFSADDFGAQAHEPEDLFRIGPLRDDK